MTCPYYLHLHQRQHVKELTAKLQQNINTYQGVELTEEGKMTLSEWLDRWLEQMATVLRPSTGPLPQ